MKNIYSLLSLLIISLASVNSFAALEKFYINKLNFCKTTKMEFNDYEPEIFPYSNNLLRAHFGGNNAEGSKIIIRGKVLDENCVPIPDAKVYLWQVGRDGKYHYAPLKNRVNEEMFKTYSEESNFIGAGFAITNNQGEFYFVTIKPAAINRNNPEVNIRVTHRLLSDLQTKLYLTNNNLMAKYGEIRKDFIPIIENSTVYDFEVVMDGVIRNSY